MERDENLPTSEDTASEERQLQVQLKDEDVLARALGIPEGDYQCVMVNSSWEQKSLLEGDIILFAEGSAPEAGDIVLIEEEGRVRLGLASKPGFLETASGRRPLEATERIIGIGLALARKLGGDRKPAPAVSESIDQY